MTDVHPRRLLVVEDDPLLAAMLSAQLTTAGFDVQTAANAAAARTLIDTFEPAAALVDIALGPGPSGIDLARAIEMTSPDIAVLFLTRYNDLAFTGSGAAQLTLKHGFLRKADIGDTQQVIAALEAVMTGASSGVIRLTDPVKPTKEASSNSAPLQQVQSLTPVQRNVLRLLAAGRTNSQIGAIRGTSVSSVEQTIATVLKALAIPRDGEVNPRVEAARLYIAAVGLPEREMIC